MKFDYQTSTDTIHPDLRPQMEQFPVNKNKANLAKKPLQGKQQIIRLFQRLTEGRTGYLTDVTICKTRNNHLSSYES